MFTSFLRALYGLFTGLRPLTKGLSYSGRGSSGQSDVRIKHPAARLAPNGRYINSWQNGARARNIVSSKWPRALGKTAGTPQEDSARRRHKGKTTGRARRAGQRKTTRRLRRGALGETREENYRRTTRTRTQRHAPACLRARSPEGRLWENCGCRDAGSPAETRETEKNSAQTWMVRNDHFTLWVTPFLG